MERTIFIFTLSLLLTGWLVGCGGKSNPKEAFEQEQAAKPIEIPDVAKVSIAGTDQMKYNKSSIEVYAGQTVQLTLTHVGELPEAAMGHNWVLLTQGTDMATFAEASITAKDNEYIAPDMTDQVIVYTEMIGGGEETSIEFEAPAAGEYTFLCSFPGHYAAMNGTFTVKPRPAGS
jgi:azurin